VSSVLYDLPGPKARARYRIGGMLTILLVAGAIAFIGYSFWSTGQFTAQKWAQFQYTEVQLSIVRGLVNTLQAAGMAGLLALVFGAVLSAGRLSDHALWRVPATTITELFRAIPLLILIFFFYFGPLSLGLHVPGFWALVLGLTLYNGSVLAEILRAGVNSVPRGQSEAAYAIGLRKTQVMNSILLPQAIRAMLPAIVSQLVVLLKDTALGFIIAYPELLYVGKEIGSKLAFDLPYVPAYLVVAAIYIALCSGLSMLAYWVQRRTSRSKKLVHARHLYLPGITDPSMAAANMVQSSMGSESRGGAL
jgi:glutamate transport system permease protein